jgi:pimeloyl-ACP methyl ester carboxylesterase
MNPAERVVPCYFGTPDKRLFGCYHEPALERLRKCAVVVCQPMGHEYVNCHRALRQLAARLCDAGFPVLRFDYYGCGDSSGSAEEGGIRQWLQDTSTAISEAKRRTGLAQTCLVGLRLGGTLAMLASVEQGDLESLVLWDPVVSGKNYLEESLHLQKETLRFRHKPTNGWKSSKAIEVLGFALPPLLCAELERIHLLPIPRKPANNVLLMQTDQVGADGLMRHLRRTEAQVEFQCLDAPQIWLPAADGSLLVPGRVLQSLVSWISRTHS